MLKNVFVRNLVVFGGAVVSLGLFVFLMESGYSRAISVGGALAFTAALAGILFALERAGPKDS